MGSRLGRRVIHFANLPIKLLLPNPPFDSIREFALKTIPSASKIEIRRVLESLYGFEIEDVQTLNREGKKKKRGGYLAAKPDYKKAYITLRSPLSISPDLFPIPWIQEAREQIGKSKRTAVVEEPESGKARTHWLDDSDGRRDGGGHRGRKHRGGGGGDGGVRERRREGRGGPKKEEESKFPWSSMRSWR